MAVLPANLRLRGVIREVLGDVACGAYSFLEVHYLRDVERPHGLPAGARQRRVSRGRRVWFRDVEYVGFDLVAELDGRLGHEDLDDRCHDMSRDNTSSVGRQRTLRFGYSHVMSQACATAAVVVEMLRQRGWRDDAKPCGAACPLR